LLTHPATTASGLLFVWVLWTPIITVWHIVVVTILVSLTTSTNPRGLFFYIGGTIVIGCTRIAGRQVVASANAGGLASPSTIAIFIEIAFCITIGSSVFIVTIAGILHPSVRGTTQTPTIIGIAVAITVCIGVEIGTALGIGLIFHAVAIVVFGVTNLDARGHHRTRRIDHQLSIAANPSTFPTDANPRCAGWAVVAELVRILVYLTIAIIIDAVANLFTVVAHNAAVFAAVVWRSIQIDKTGRAAIFTAERPSLTLHTRGRLVRGRDTLNATTATVFNRIGTRARDVVNGAIAIVIDRITGFFGRRILTCAADRAPTIAAADGQSFVPTLPWPTDEALFSNKIALIDAAHAVVIDAVTTFISAGENPTIIIITITIVDAVSILVRVTIGDRTVAARTVLVDVVTTNFSGAGTDCCIRIVTVQSRGIAITVRIHDHVFHQDHDAHPHRVRCAPFIVHGTHENIGDAILTRAEQRGGNALIALGKSVRDFTRALDDGEGNLDHITIDVFEKCF
jgi:hypothetical protein